MQQNQIRKFNTAQQVIKQQLKIGKTRKWCQIINNNTVSYFTIIINK